MPRSLVFTRSHLLDCLHRWLSLRFGVVLPCLSLHRDKIARKVPFCTALKLNTPPSSQPCFSTFRVISVWQLAHQCRLLQNLQWVYVSRLSYNSCNIDLELPVLCMPMLICGRPYQCLVPLRPSEISETVPGQAPETSFLSKVL